MKHNMGSIDRTLRGVVGVAAIALGVYYQSWWGALGAIPLATTLLGWCPMYLPFGLSTRRKD
jgi:hypothetical protein